MHSRTSKTSSIPRRSRILLLALTACLLLAGGAPPLPEAPVADEGDKKPKAAPSPVRLTPIPTATFTRSASSHFQKLQDSRVGSGEVGADDEITGLDMEDMTGDPCDDVLLGLGDGSLLFLAHNCGEDLASPDPSDNPFAGVNANPGANHAKQGVNLEVMGYAKLRGTVNAGVAFGDVDDKGDLGGGGKTGDGSDDGDDPPILQGEIDDKGDLLTGNANGGVTIWDSQLRTGGAVSGKRGVSWRDYEFVPDTPANESGWGFTPPLGVTNARPVLADFLTWVDDYAYPTAGSRVLMPANDNTYPADGKPDLCIGFGDGGVRCWAHRDGAAPDPPFQALPQDALDVEKRLGTSSSIFFDPTGEPMDQLIDAMAHPFFYDYDADGDLDLVVGGLCGVLVYQNRAESGEIEFVLDDETQLFPDIPIDTCLEALSLAAAPKRLTTHEPPAKRADMGYVVGFGDVDGDGRKDAYVAQGNTLSRYESNTDETVVPVELVSFNALAEGEAVTLRWATASETINAGFEIEQRGRGEKAWTVIGFVEGAGTTAVPQQYSYVLAGLAPGRYTFRLKQIDFDGRFEYSPEVEVAVAVPGEYLLSPAYPNPFNPQAVFTLALAREQHVRITVYNELGRQVGLLHDGALAGSATHTFVLEGSQWPSGLYFYEVQGETFRDRRSVLLVK